MSTAALWDNTSGQWAALALKLLHELLYCEARPSVFVPFLGGSSPGKRSREPRMQDVL